MATVQLIIFVTFALIITICLGFPAIISKPEDIENLTLKEKRDLFRINQARSSQFKCSPRPRSFRSADLFKEENDASSIIYPYNYVLHRCDSQSGCCSDSLQVCEEAETTKVILMFQFFNKLNNEREFKSQIVSNHTQCKCERIKSQRLPQSQVPETHDVVTNNAKNSKSMLFIPTIIYYILSR